MIIYFEDYIQKFGKIMTPGVLVILKGSGG
jgi:hypothetical protein